MDAISKISAIFVNIRNLQNKFRLASIMNSPHHPPMPPSQRGTNAKDDKHSKVRRT